MRKITVELTEQTSGNWAWHIRVRSHIPGDLLVRAAALGRVRGRITRPADEDEATTVEAAVYSAALCVMDLYDDIANHPALYGTDVPSPGVSNRTRDRATASLLDQLEASAGRKLEGPHGPSF